MLVGILLLYFWPEIHVSVQNTGSAPMQSVVLHVTGKSYSIGDIFAGGSASATVEPTGESGLEIEFIDAYGTIKRLNAGGYFESGYRGTIQVSIKDGTIVKNEQDIKLW